MTNKTTNKTSIEVPEDAMWMVFCYEGDMGRHDKPSDKGDRASHSGA